MEFDFKVTTWERVTVAKEDEQIVLNGIKNGEITSSDDLNNMEIVSDCYPIEETKEQMSVFENGGCSTIEVCEDKNVIYSNGE